ncbi:replication initiator protein A [Brevibacillus reuszeri]|uniref:replication initiator protein A n=1 Tax=Brevibacillus reuszeri TaxID=54915 RepID=UPI003D1EBB96
MATSTKQTKIQKDLDKFIKELLAVEAKESEEEKARLHQELFEKAASALQSKHTFIELITKENELVRERDSMKAIELERLKILDYSIKLIRLAQERRKKGHQQNDVTISKAILESGAIMFASASKKNESKKMVPMPIEKHAKGEKVLTYYNPLGKASRFDSRVFIALHKLWEDKGRNQQFSFTMYEICKVLNLNTSGKTYQNIENSLEVLFNMSVEMRYYIKQKDERIIVSRFHMLSADQQITTVAPGTDKKLSVQRSIIFSDLLQLSLLEGYVSYISLALLEDIQKDTAHHLYLLLSSSTIQEFGRCEFEFDDLCDIIGIRKEHPKYKKKQLLNEAINELIEVKVLERAQFPAKTTKVFLYPSEWFATIISAEGRLLEEKSQEIPLLLERIEKKHASVLLG